MAQSAEAKFTYKTGRVGAEQLGYEKQVVDALPDSLMELFCGVGNPFSLGAIKDGYSVLDIGCGGGVDLVVAYEMTGGTGKVCGVDLSRKMVDRATDNLAAHGLGSLEIQHINSADLPYDNEFFDVVISNGVVNLSPEKLRLFQEAHRVLKPGGRLQFADIVMEKPLPGPEPANLDSWAQ